MCNCGGIGGRHPTAPRRNGVVGCGDISTTDLERRLKVEKGEGLSRDVLGVLE